MNAKGIKKNVMIIYIKLINRYLMANDPKNSAPSTGIFLSRGNGRKIMAPIQLKSKCAIAMLIAVSVLNRAANKAVIVVPTLAPIMKGNALLSFTLLVATRGTISDVVTELL